MAKGLYCDGCCQSVGPGHTAKTKCLGPVWVGSISIDPPPCDEEMEIDKNRKKDEEYEVTGVMYNGKSWLV